MKKCSPQWEVSGVIELNLTFNLHVTSHPSPSLPSSVPLSISASLGTPQCLSWTKRKCSGVSLGEWCWCFYGSAMHSQGSKEVGSRGGGGGRELHGSPFSILQLLTAIWSPHWTPATLLKASPAYRWVSEIAQPPLLFRGIPWVGLGEGPSSWFKFTVLLSSIELSNQ